MVFSADDRILIKMLRQEKGYGAKKFMAEFPSKPDLGEATERVYRSQIHDVVRHCIVGPEFCYNLTLFVGVMTMYTGVTFFVDTVYIWIKRNYPVSQKNCGPNFGDNFVKS